MGISQQIGASSLLKSGVCTSSTRPASPYEGQVIYETDTDKTLVWNGTTWIVTAHSGAWQAWSPTYTNLTIGNGTVIARYSQVGKTVTFVFEFTLGSSGSSVGSAPAISLPVVGATVVNSWLGTARYLDNGVTNYAGAVAILSNGIRPQTLVSSGTYAEIQGGITATAPFTWASGDVMSISGIYEAS